MSDIAKVRFDKNKSAAHTPPVGPEAKLAKTLTTWLRNDGWDVYEEVSPWGYGTAADVVAVRTPVVTVVEVKTTMSLAVLGQARQWVGKAHQVYVAVPGFKRGSAFDGAKWVCETLGLGLLCVTSNVFEAVRPTFHRRADTKLLLEHLRPEQQDGSMPAGTASGRRWTPWRLTLSDLTRVVTESPGIPMAEALKKMKHHYRNDKSAKASLSHQIRKGIIKTLRAEGRDLKLYPV